VDFNVNGLFLHLSLGVYLTAAFPELLHEAGSDNNLGFSPRAVKGQEEFRYSSIETETTSKQLYVIQTIYDLPTYLQPSGGSRRKHGASGRFQITLFSCRSMKNVDKIILSEYQALN
jgi:hypothetical protein